MATGNSGSFTLSGSQNFAVKINWSETYNESANTHVVSITSAELISYNWYGFTYYPNGTLSINGSTVVTFNSQTGTHNCTIQSQSAGYPIIPATGSSYPAAPWSSGSIAGNADGTKSVSIAANFQCFTLDGRGGSGWSVSGSQNVTLHTIPRTSSISMPATTMGSANNITITRASSSFTHTLTYSFGSATGTIATKTTSTSVSWTPPTSLASQIPNSTSGSCTLTCYTYNGSTLVGTSTATVTLSVPTSIKPTITSITAMRVNGDVPSSWGIYVQTKSKVTLTINGAAGAGGSTISSYSITGGGLSYTQSSVTTGFLNTSGSITFTGKVCDSRGRWSDEKTVTITVVAYAAPKISAYSTHRCTSAGASSANGTYGRANVTFTYSSCSSKNTITTAIAYKKSSASSYTNAGVSFTSGTDAVFGGGNLDTESSYDIRYTLTDAFTTVTVVDTLSTASVLMDFKAGGTGLAIGKVSELDQLECAWDADFAQDVNIAGDAHVTGNSYTSRLYVHGSVNTSSTRFIYSDAITNMILRVNGVNPIVATTTAVRAGASDYGNVTLGTSGYPWKAVYGTALYGTTIYENGTSIASKYLPLAGGTVTGTLTLSRTTDASGTADNKPALIVGSATGTHLELDGNELMAKASGTTTAALYLNDQGGSVYVNGNLLFYSTVIGYGSMSQNGTLSGTIPADTRMFIIMLNDTSAWYSMAVPKNSFTSGQTLHVKATSDYYTFKINFSGTTATLTKVAAGTKTVYFIAVR